MPDTLPSDSCQQPLSNSASSPAATPVLRRVLLVEDEPDIEVVVRLCLESVGAMQVSWCSSGAQAVETAAREQPDLILLDMMMPDSDGLEVLGALRASPLTRHIPTVFLTARAQPNQVEEYRRAGASGVVSKPFDPMALPQQLRRIFSEAMSASENSPEL